MTVLTTLFPVFFMLLLGLVSHIKGWVTVNQKNGANSIIFKILFPVLVFNLMANANIELSHISIILWYFTNRYRKNSCLCVTGNGSHRS